MDYAGEACTKVMVCELVLVVHGQPIVAHFDVCRAAWLQLRVLAHTGVAIEHDSLHASAGRCMTVFAVELTGLSSIRRVLGASFCYLHGYQLLRGETVRF